jgi:hypothetical protein
MKIFFQPDDGQQKLHLRCDLVGQYVLLSTSECVEKYYFVHFLPFLRLNFDRIFIKFLPNTVYQ